MSGRGRHDDGFARLGDLLGEAVTPGARPVAPSQSQSQPRRVVRKADQPAGAVPGGVALTLDMPGADDETGERVAKGRVRELADPARRIVEVWTETVGPEIAANAHPLQLRAGRLVVSTSSSAWAQALQFMGEEIQADLNRRLQTEVVGSIFFRHAGWDVEPDDDSGTRDGRGHRHASGHDAAVIDEAVMAEAATETGTPRLHTARGVSARKEGPASADPTVNSETHEGFSLEQQAALDEVRSLGLDSKLSNAIARAMMKAFVREER
jgi:hypothetical protein